MVNNPHSEIPAMTPQQKKLTDDSLNPLALYKSIAVGDASWGSFFYYELNSLLLSGLSGVVGLGLRSVLYPCMFAKCGKRPAFGKGLVVRQPNCISLGKKIVIDDYSTIDARGNSNIAIDDFVSIGRFTTITAKNSKITLHRGANIGSYVRIATQSSIEIGESTLVAAYCYIGAGNHQAGDSKVPLIAQDMEIKGGVKIGKNCWIGAQAMILDGVTIGDGAVIGAQALVKEDVPAGAVVVGTPARIISS